MDAITLLKNDHKTLKRLFREFERLGDRAEVTKAKVVNEMLRELSIHAAIEEAVFYPAVKDLSQDLRENVLESLEEHHVAKWLCKELDGLKPDAERFDAKVKVLIESVEHHIEEEEGDFFPKVRETLGRKTLGEIGALLEDAKAMAPTHPHPRSPDEPPLGGMAAAVAGLVDRARDARADLAASGRKKLMSSR